MANAIECPECGSAASRVVDSRPRHDPIPHIYRRRRCKCGQRYGTREFMDDVGFAAFVDANGISGRDRAIVETMIAQMRSVALSAPIGEDIGGG